MQAVQVERIRRGRTATLARSNSYFLIHYAFLWVAIVLGVRGLRLVLDFLDSIYPYATPAQADAFTFLNGLEGYAVTLAWLVKVHAVVPCWKERQVRICYQPCLIMDSLVTMNYTLQVMLMKELPTMTAGWLASDTRLLAYATAAMLFWQEAGSAALLLGRHSLAVVLSGCVVACLTLGAWSALCSESVLDPVFVLAISLGSMSVTYVSLPPLLTKTY